MGWEWEREQLRAANYFRGRQDGRLGKVKDLGVVGYDEGYKLGSAERQAWELTQKKPLVPGFPDEKKRGWL